MKEKSLPIVPDPALVNTGEESGPIEVQHEFFARVLEFLGYDTDNKIGCFTKVEDNMLTEFSLGTPIPTDNRIVLLNVRGYVVASVLYWKNDMNYVYVVYASYLHEEIIKRVHWRDRD